MNYSELSDFEINKAVAIALGYPEEDCEFGWSGKPHVGVEWNEETGYPTKSFDFCSSWADAGPIIQKHGIGFLRIDEATGGSEDMVGCWYANGPVDWMYGECDSDFAYRDRNPLRAAMVVFLIMQEAQ